MEIAKKGYNLTHYDTGMNVTYYSKLKEVKADLENIVFKIKNLPKEFLENAINTYEKAEIESEVKE